MKLAVLQLFHDLVNLFCGSLCAGFTQRCDGNCIFVVAFCPVRSYFPAVHHGLEEILVIYLPGVGSGGKCCGRSGLEHVDVVSYRVADLPGIQKLLCGSRSAGGVCVLADDDAALGDQLFSCSSFFVDIEPGIGIKDFHDNIRYNALEAKVECGITGNDLCIVVSADITDLHIAVRVKAVRLHIGCQGAALQQLCKLHACYHAGYIAGFIYFCKSVLEVGAAADGSKIAGHGYKRGIRIFLRCHDHEGLMSIAVGNDQIAALAYQVYCRIITGRVFCNFVFPYDLALIHSELFRRLADTVHMSLGITFGLVTDQDHAYLQIICLCSHSADGKHGNGHSSGECDAHDFLQCFSHFFFSSLEISK